MYATIKTTTDDNRGQVLAVYGIGPTPEDAKQDARRHVDRTEGLLTVLVEENLAEDIRAHGPNVARVSAASGVLREREFAVLKDYETGARIRAATAEELQESIDQAEFDGGRGVIVVDCRLCYAVAV